MRQRTFASSTPGAARTLIATLAATMLLSGCAGTTLDSPTDLQPDSSSKQKATTPSTASVTTPMASAADYTRVCGICHLPTGEGVPGAFPPLNARLASLRDTEEGRNYLVGILKNGLYGQIDVAGTNYSGAMPPVVGQLDADGMAGMLNYVMSTFAQVTAGFTGAEITTRSEAIGSISSASMRKALSDSL